jgi:hypothetical protein
MKNGKYIKNGIEIWYEEGIIHREEGPAIIWPDGYEEWLVYGLRHRIDGPAVMSSLYKEYEWWLHGRCLSTKEAWWQALSDKDKLRSLFSLEPL